MTLNFPTAAELRDEQHLKGPSTSQMSSKDSAWCVKLKDNDGLEPADVHGA
ncbi:hypothetical protein SBI_04411 [Streptomyces bingchenggensis BCW-1]|uniref:Uncharacterized protein n=1 Tax=Streptomyces bingchenggensis (strain BCW-1) TaxID=749414 RepID=D7BVD0_STRBB|nr:MULTISPECIES: hypothetical protein [Streptomyces]ADI07531.1 hypothetical protein SBI_04411 [Streptomyces bingchenggensis BCW-1]